MPSGLCGETGRIAAACARNVALPVVAGQRSAAFWPGGVRPRDLRAKPVLSDPKQCAWKVRPVGSPNIIAYVMLLVWPLVVWQLWKRLDPQRALIWTVLAGYMVLPPLTSFDFPVVPDFDKVSIPNLMALICAAFLLGDRISFLPRGWLGRFLIAAYVFSPFATVLTNGDPLIFVEKTIAGMRIYDSFSAVATQAIALIPFFLARRYLVGDDGMKTLLAALVAAGLAYSLPMLVEAVMSPQLNVWIYGFFQHDFSQTIRFGGFRPVVFMPHGLWVAFFALMAMIAALTFLRRTTPEARPKALVVFMYLSFMLVICRSAGPLVYAIALTPLILFCPPRFQILLAALMAVLVLTYPTLRGAHLVPLDQILEVAYSFSEDRGQSLQYRIDNEEILLDRAQERPWFGWGGYGRAFTHDPVTGAIWNVADGAWVIIMGTYGWVGYVTEFGLTALPLLLLGVEVLRQPKAALSPYTSAVALILGINMVDLLPNATHIPMTWLLAGALLGESERLASQRRERTRVASRERMHPGKPSRTII